MRAYAHTRTRALMHAHARTHASMNVHACTGDGVDIHDQLPVAARALATLVLLVWLHTATEVTLQGHPRFPPAVEIAQ